MIDCVDPPQRGAALKFLQTPCPKPPFVFPLLRPDGDAIEVQATEWPLTEGSPFSVLLIEDLRSRREAEERSRDIFDEAPIAYHELDSQGIVCRVNRAECELLGFEADEILGKAAWDFVAPEQREAYREGFRRGYYRAMANLTGTPPPEMHADWDTVPEEFNAIQQRGFHDGIVGAQRDFENHRPPNVDNRDEFRHPDNVPPEFREAYRDAFRRGYNRAMAHLMGQPWRY